MHNWNKHILWPNPCFLICEVKVIRVGNNKWKPLKLPLPTTAQPSWLFSLRGRQSMENGWMYYHKLNQVVTPLTCMFFQAWFHCWNKSTYSLVTEAQRLLGLSRFWRHQGFHFGSGWGPIYLSNPKDCQFWADSEQEKALYQVCTPTQATQPLRLCDLTEPDRAWSVSSRERCSIDLLSSRYWWITP